MIINSDALRTAHGPNGLIHHLLGKPEDNETIRLVAGSQNNIRFAYDDARSHNSLRAVLHIKLSPDTRQSMSQKNWAACVDQLAGEYGFTPSAATIIEHKKKGRVHRHIVVPFVHPVTGKKLDMGFSKLRDEKCARLLEMQLGHQLTPMKPGHRQAVSTYLQKSGQEQAALHVAALPDSGIGTSLMAHQKAKRLGRDLADEKQLIKSLFQQSDNPAAFRAALKSEGYTLQKGEKAGRFIIVNTEGQLIGSANRLIGKRVKEFQNYMETEHEVIRQRDIPHIDNITIQKNTVTAETPPPSSLSLSPLITSNAYTQTVQHAASEPLTETTRHASRRPSAPLIGRNSETKHQSRPSIRGRSKPVGPGSRRPQLARRPDSVASRNTHEAGRIGAQQRRTANSYRKAFEPLLGKLQKPLTPLSSLRAQIRLRTGLDSAYFMDLWPEDGMREPVSHNIAYRAQLIRSYYFGDDKRALTLARKASWVEVKDDHINIRLKEGGQFRDYGDRMTCPPGPIQPRTAREIVLSAKAKGWPAIKVTGTEAFKDEVALHAYLNNISCDHVLSPEGQARLREIKEKRDYYMMPEEINKKEHDNTYTTSDMECDSRTDNIFNL